MPERERVRRRPTWFSGTSSSNKHYDQLCLRSLDPGHHSLDCRFHGTVGVALHGVGRDDFDGTFYCPQNTNGALVSPLGFFSSSPIMSSKPLLIGNSLGRSVEYFATNHRSFSDIRFISSGKRKGRCPLSYKRDILDSTQKFEKGENTFPPFLSLTRSLSLETSAEEHCASFEQRQFLVTVRQAAMKLFLFTFVGILLVCILSKESNHINASLDAENSNDRGLPRVESMPLTRKEEDIAKHHHKHLIEDEITLEEMGGLQKLREEFGEWMKHHRRDYHSTEEKEKRFLIWQDNHRR